MDLEHLLDRFDAEHCAPHSISPMRRLQQAQILRNLAATLPYDLDQLQPNDLAAFMGGEISRGISPKTALKYQWMVYAFVTWASNAGVIDRERAERIKSVPKPRGSNKPYLPDPYTPAEIRTLYETLNARFPVIGEHGRGSQTVRKMLRGRLTRRDQRPLRKGMWRHARRLQYEAQIALALEQALRAHEISHLSIPALHPDNDQLVVLTAKQGPGREVRRSIPYATHARNAVREWLDFRAALVPEHEEPWLVLSLGTLAEQLSPQPARYMREGLPAVLGPGWEFRRLRHTAATEWLRAGVPLEKVRLYLGHSNISTTLLYTQIINSDMQSAFDDAEERFAKRLGLAA